MIQLNDALAEQFPTGDEWVRGALSSLGDSLQPTSLVHAVVGGWVQRPDSVAVDLVETLFVLLPDRLGLGQTDGDERIRWIPMDAIQNLDAIDDSPLPLQTVEICLADGSTIKAGWTDSFSEQIVGVLISLISGGSPAATAPDPEIETAPEQPAADVATADAPSMAVEADTTPDLPAAPQSERWIEESAEVAVEPTGEADSTAWFSVGANIDDPPLNPSVFTANEDLPAFLREELIKVNEEQRAAAAPEPQPPTALADLPAPPVEARGVAPSEAPPVFGEPSHYNPATQYADSGLEPASTWSFDDVLEPAPPAADAQLPAPPAGAAIDPSSMADHGQPPWLAPGMMWPEPMRGVLYLGGHPAHSRKRKNGTMVFSPNGIDVGGVGLQNWSMSMEWAYVESVDIQGPDEVMFADHLKIDSASSALIVTMIDGTRMFFEVRTRRPPSLRSSLAPVLSMVQSLGSHRVSH